MTEMQMPKKWRSVVSNGEWKTWTGNRPLPRHMPTPKWNGVYERDEEWPDTAYDPNHAALNTKKE